MLLLLLLLSATSSVLCRKNYTRYALIFLQPKEGDNYDSLRKLLDDNKVDVWGLPSAIINEKSILIPPDLVGQVENVLKSSNITYEILTRNIQQWIDKEYEENPSDNASAGNRRNIPLDVYHTLEAINSHIDYLAHSTWPIVKVDVVGTTFEGNPLKVLKIITSKSVEKPVIWIDSAIHASEWTTPATSLYIIHQLLDKRSSDPEIKKLLTAFDWYFWPIINPDGYNYTWFEDRLWRKNRAPSLRNYSCKGTDLNRNFGVAFGDSTGSKVDPCSEKYHGPSAFSENETKAYRDQILKLGKRIKAVVSLHSYGQLLLSPYGYKSEHPPDYENQMKALDLMKSAIERVHGKIYTAGSVANVIYFASGSSIDWVYDEGNVDYSFTIEVRDTGREGYLLPKSQIISTAEEIFAAIKELANFLLQTL